MRVILITARNEVGARLCFYTCLWFCSQGEEGGVVSQHALQVSRPTTGGKLRGLAWGGSPGPHPGGKLRGQAWEGLRPTLRRGSWGVGPGGSPGPHLGGSPAPHPGGVYFSGPHSWGSPGPHPGGGYPTMHWGRHHPLPPSRWLLLRAVRILLECILVYFFKVFGIVMNPIS